MVLIGKQKAAMLLMSLDAATAAEMLKGIDAKVVQDLAVELAYLDASGYSSRQSLALAQEFYDSLQSREEFHLRNFLNQMLRSTVGNEKARQIQTQIQDLLQKRDPFISVRSADAQNIASVLGSEHPLAIAVVLSELPARKSSEVLGLLGEGIRLSVISRMTSSSESITTEAKTRIAKMLCNRLEAKPAGLRTGASATRPKKSLRKVAMILRNLGKELRDGLLNSIKEKDSRASDMIAELMIVWEDIPQITDRSLAEAIRRIDAGKLALALVGADNALIQKIKSNISERAAAAVDEETSLMSTPMREDIKKAKDEIVQVLRKANSKDGLAFIEE